MAKIVNIILKSDHDNNWSIGVIRNDNYAEITSNDTHEIDNEIKKIVEFANKIKTKEQIEKEEIEERNKKLIGIITKKTTVEEQIKLVDSFPRWEMDSWYKIDERVNYQDTLYICKKDHKSDYQLIPSLALEYWKKAQEEKKNYPIYDHETTYKINDKVIFNGKIYNSLIKQQGQSPFSSPKTWEDEGRV